MMRKIFNFMFLALGIACIAYWLVCGVMTTFGQSMLFVWPVMGAAFLVRYAVVRKYIRLGKPVPLPGWLKISVRIASCALIVLFVATQLFVINGFTSACPENVDYVIVLGAKTGSITINGRTQLAAEYLLENPETRVIVTGGQGPDEYMPEADYMKQRLVEYWGIEEDRIIVENKSASTDENLAFSVELMDEDTESIAVVSNNYHVARAMGIARKYFDGEIYAIPMHSNPYSLPHYMLREFFTVTVDGLLGNIKF